jgi:hypothetical protein
MNCSTSQDWTAIIALGVAIVSLAIGVYFSRKTLRLTMKHNKKSTEPYITDIYSALHKLEVGNSIFVSYDIKNCGFGPAIIKSLNFTYRGKNYPTIFDIYKKLFETLHHENDSSILFMLDSTHIIASNDSVTLFNMCFKERKYADQFQQITKVTGIFIEYESIYGEKKTFAKERLSP